MAKIIFIAFLIMQIVNAIRKSKRQQAEKRQLRERVQLPMVSDVDPVPVKQVSAKTVTAQDISDADLYTDTSDRWYAATQDASDFLTSSDTAQAQLQESAVNYQKTGRTSLKSANIGRSLAIPGRPDDYAIEVPVVRRAIRLDKESLRTYMLTRELLGPPRVKRPYRAGPVRYR